MSISNTIAAHRADLHPDAASVARPQRWTLGVVCTATALLLFNVTAPNVALPSIAADLRLSFTSQQWVLSSYALVLASLLLAGGALGDRFGRRRLFLAGLGVFAVGSAVAALAGSGTVMIVGRSVQGIGAAAIFPAGLALVAASSTARREPARSASGVPPSPRRSRWDRSAAACSCRRCPGARAFSSGSSWPCRPPRWPRRHVRESRALDAAGARHRGDGRADRGDVPVRLRAAGGQPARLGLGAGRGRRARRRRGVRRVRRRRAPRRPAADRACADAQPDLRRGDARRASVRSLRVRPDRLHHPAADPRAARLADHGGRRALAVRRRLVRRLATGREGRRARRGPSHARRRPAALCRWAGRDARRRSARLRGPT